MASDIEFEDLETAALTVIEDLQSIKEYRKEKLAVCGGMAVIWYTGSGARATKVYYHASLILIYKDVDFYTTIPGAPGDVKRKLANKFPDRYSSIADMQVFYYKAPDGKEVQIDFVPDWQVSNKHDSAEI